MTQVNELYLRFTPSGSPDVVGYKLYLQLAPDPVSYTSTSFDLGNPPASGSPALVELNLATLPGMTTYDGTYNLGVTTVDDAGNESSMRTAEGVELDFVAPDPPGPISVG